MRNTIKAIATAVIIAGFSNASNAQATATATATATIVTPISISSDVNMNFGNIAVKASSGGTVILSEADGSRNKTGDVTLPANVGTVTRAHFDVSGQPNYTYAITLPSSVVLTRASGSETMTANAFTSSVGATSTLSGAGTESFYVGATLTVDAGQAAGTYTSENFDVTVNYN